VAVTNSIRRCRFLSGEITQKELAKIIGVSRQTLMAIEAGKYPPSLEVAFRIASFFNLSIEDVFFYAPDIEGAPDTKGHKIVEAYLRGDDPNDVQ
jgi:putative transcriptional regulator